MMTLLFIWRCLRSSCVQAAYLYLGLENASLVRMIMMMIMMRASAAVRSRGSRGSCGSATQSQPRSLRSCVCVCVCVDFDAICAKITHARTYTLASQIVATREGLTVFSSHRDAWPPIGTLDSVLRSLGPHARIGPIVGLSRTRLNHSQKPNGIHSQNPNGIRLAPR